ncbi:Putative gustatory receptor 28b [Trachymyrmex cornetzi]|uniref:Gustatory receptor n=1 Tax=Trachymyrmex cornetzi TaxID=471704 RepID=A0A195DA54_9HYME|nr:Putative gustatory receptor 28b [Trachymyrmex cornetzi]
MSSINNSNFVNFNKTSNFFGNINKKNSYAGKNNEQKVNKIKSELHQDLFWTFRILIMFFKLIGLATFAHRIVIYKKRTLYTFQYSKIGIVYNIVLSSLLITCCYVSISFDLYHHMNLATCIYSLEFVLNALSSYVTLIRYCINQKSLVRIVNRLITIEHEIDRMYDLYHPLRRQRVFYTMIIACILNICLLIFVIYFDIFVMGFVIVPIEDLLVFHVSWLLIQYSLLVTVIQTYFTDVNRAIQSLTRINTSDLRLQSLYQTRRIVVNNSTVHQLLQLRDMHCHLCEIAEDVSSFYSLPVLFGIVYFFLSLICDAYSLLWTLLFFGIFDFEYHIYHIVSIIVVIYPIFLLTTRITRILIEMQKTGNIVHDLLKCAIGKEIKTELKKFSLQLLHRKVQFTANGYFRLDNTFFHSLIGTVTTYFVILVQFRIGTLSSSINANFTESNVTVQG